MWIRSSYSWKNPPLTPLTTFWLKNNTPATKLRHVGNTSNQPTTNYLLHVYVEHTHIHTQYTPDLQMCMGVPTRVYYGGAGTCRYTPPSQHQKEYQTDISPHRWAAWGVTSCSLQVSVCCISVYWTTEKGTVWLVRDTLMVIGDQRAAESPLANTKSGGPAYKGFTTSHIPCITRCTTPNNRSWASTGGYMPIWLHAGYTHFLSTINLYQVLSDATVGVHFITHCSCTLWHFDLY